MLRRSFSWFAPFLPLADQSDRGYKGPAFNSRPSQHPVVVKVTTKTKPRKHPFFFITVTFIILLDMAFSLSQTQQVK